MSNASTVLGANRAEFELEVGTEHGSELSVLGFDAWEELSRPYTVDVTFAARRGLVVKELEGAKGLFTVVKAEGAARYFDGVAEGAEVLGPTSHPEKWRYRLRLRPRLWELSERRRSRVYQEQTAVEIAVAVLKEGKVEHRLSLSGSYAKREYCVQHRESDFDFVSRLLEEEGIFYWFEHGKGTHTLVLGDSRSAYGTLQGGGRIAFREERGMVPDEEAFTAFGERRRTRAGVVELRDVDYLRPQLDLTARAGKGELEAYDHHGGYVAPEVGRARARVRLEELGASAERWRGKSTSRRLCPGYVFELTDSPGMNGEYVVVSVRHRGDQPEALAGALAVGRSGYQSRVSCLRKEIAYRPERRTAPPKIAGWQAGVVVGPAGEEIHTDEHGRVKVQFHWDREGKEDDHASCWIRVAQAMAGPGFGALYLPRVGQEVAVSFEEGCPDRPLVVGAAYNGENPTPLDLPAEKTKSTLKSRSSPGDGGLGFNELRFEDAAGSEEVFLHAQKDLEIEVLNDKGQKVGGNEKLLVAKDRSREVGGNQALTVKGNDAGNVLGNQALEVAQNRTTAVGMNHVETVAGSQTVNVGGAQAVTVALASAETVGLAKALSVGGAYLVNVGAAMNEVVVGAKTEEVGGAKVELVGLKKTETVGGSRTLHVGGDLTERVGQKRTLRVEKDLVVGVSGKLAQTVKEEYAVHAKEAVITAEERFAVRTGSVTLTLEKDGSVVLKGGKLELNGTADLLLKAPTITENG